MRILLIDGDKRSSAFLKQGLASEGFAVDVASDAGQALELAGHIPYDALLLNGNYTDHTSYGILAALRKQRCPAAILVFSDKEPAAGQPDSVTAATDAFLTRPTLQDLVDRLHTFLGRTQDIEPPRPAGQVLKIGDLRMDLTARRVEWRGKEIPLTKKEFELLECLMRHPGRVMSQEVIAQQIWDIHFHGHSNVVETHIRRLRAKLGDRFPAHLIKTVRGFGYRFAA